MSKIYIGDIGTNIIVDLGSDITTATVKKIKYKKPDGTEGEWLANISGTRFFTYTSVSGDLDPIGKWILNAYVEMPAWQGHGETFCMVVHDIYK